MPVQYLPYVSAATEMAGNMFKKRYITSSQQHTKAGPAPRRRGRGGGTIQVEIGSISDLLQCSTKATNSHAAGVDHVKLAIHASTNVRSDAEGAGKTCYTSYGSLFGDSLLNLHLLSYSWRSCYTCQNHT